MTKKTWTRILMVIVAGLWAYNIYRTVENYQVNKATQEMVQNTPISITPAVFNKDTFELHLPDRDPFLGHVKWKRKNQAASSTSGGNPVVNQPKPVVQQPPKTPAKWPEIKYFGFVKNRDQAHLLCLLNVDHHNLRYAPHETKNGITVLDAYRDSVHIVFQGEMRTFLK